MDTTATDDIAGEGAAQAPAAQAPAAQAPAGVQAFTFGEPVPILDQRDVISYFHSSWNGRYHEPPISLDGLARLLPSNPDHQSALAVKKNILKSCFVPDRVLTRAEFERLAQDYLVFGNAYLVMQRNRLGQPLKLQSARARWTCKADDGRFLILRDGREEPIEGEVLHLAVPDVNQDLYGVPDYTAAIQSALLNEAATLFRRKYYLNGSHAGFILYMNDAAQSQDDIDALRQAMRDAKGPGNFKNLFMYAPNGKPDGIKVIPIAEIAAKDEFFSLKTVSRDDVLAAHRVPPQLLGVLPANTGGFGDVDKAARVFATNELEPLMETFRDEINGFTRARTVDFRPYSVAMPAA